MSSVLLIDDNEDILTANREYLTDAHGMDVDCAETGIKALDCLRAKRYGCIVLDILLPDLDGFAVCKAARTITETPILFLSCLEESGDKVKGLMAGGDDYMTKPYSLEEFGARIFALMRRGKGIIDRPKSDYYIDADNRLIYALGKNIFLTEREFMLFQLFNNNPGKSFSNEELLKIIWHGNAEITTLVSLVSRLRSKIKFAEEIIGKVTTSYGAGYCLVLPKVKSAK